MQKTQAQAVFEAPALRVVGVGELENGRGFYLVPSESDPTRYYVVEQWPARLVCHCKDAFFRHRTCKHMRAAIEHKARLQLEQLADARADVAETRQELQAINADADAAAADSVSREARTAPLPDAGRGQKTPAHGRYFGARSQEPFSFMR